MNRHVYRSFFFFLLFTPSLLLAQSGNSDNNSLNFENQGRIYTDPAAAQLSQTPTLDAVDETQYLLGPNDILSIEIEGLFNLFAQNIVVNAQGDIVIPQLGTVNVNSLTIKEAKEAVQKKISSRYNETQLGIFSLVKAKNVVVTINGNISEQRSLALPGMTRLHNVINRVISPSVDKDSETGLSQNQNPLLDFSSYVTSSRRLQNQIPASELAGYTQSDASLYQQLSTYALRSISVKNKLGEIRYFDLLSYINAGKSSQSPVLNSGDHITLKKLGPDAPHTSISGEVSRPGVFEYLNTDSFDQLLALSGGLTSQADSSSVQVFENGNWQTTTINELLSRSSFAPNTHIIVGKNNNLDRMGTVWVSGEVSQAGNYPLVPGQTTVKMVVERSGGLTMHALSNGIYIERQTSDDNSKRGKQEFESQLLKRSSNQVIEGFEYLDLEQNITKQRLFVNFEENAENFVLQDGDHIVVPYNTHSVFVFGQVNIPGMFSYNADRNIEAYLELAGGKSVAAQKKRVFIIKAGSKTWYKPGDTTIQPGDYIFVDRKPYIDYSNQARLEAEDQRLFWQQISVVVSAISTAVLLISVLQ